MSPAQTIFTLFVILQGTYSIVLLGVIILYTLFFWRKEKDQRLRIVCLGLSHLLLICCTSMTIWFGFYPLWHVWYFMVFVAYVLSDWMLLRLWVQVIKLNKAQ